MAGFSFFFSRANISSRGKRMKIHRLNLNNAFGKLYSICSLLAVLALVLCTSFDAHAQVVTASVRGAVTDQQGAAVAGADVSITNEDTGYTRSMKTGSDGEYNFPDLPLGTYRIHVTHEGFQGETHPGLVLHVADSLVVRVGFELRR